MYFIFRLLSLNTMKSPASPYSTAANSLSASCNGNAINTTSGSPLRYTSTPPRIRDINKPSEGVYRPSDMLSRHFRKLSPKKKKITQKSLHRLLTASLFPAQSPTFPLTGSNIDPLDRGNPQIIPIMVQTIKPP